MQHLDFRYEISIEVIFHTIDLSLLFYASVRHYDRYCKGLAEQGGALRASLCYLETEDGEHLYPVEALDSEEKILTYLASHTTAKSKFFLKFRELDLMAKTMEYYGTSRKVRGVMKDIGLDPGPPEADQRLVDHVNKGLRDAMQAINARHGEVK